MKKLKIKKPSNTVISAIITFLIGFLFIGWWFAYDPTADLLPSIPGMDNKPEASELAAELGDVTIGELFDTFEGSPSKLQGDWDQFRGIYADNIAINSPRLADQWKENGPDILWSVDLGEGHAAPAVKNGRVYLLDYDEEKKADALRCFSLDDGKEIWRRWYRVKVKRNHGMSRTVPAVTDDYVVTIGPRCHVMCADALTGDFLWGLDLERDYSTKTPFWYTGQCPYIDGNQVIIAPSGTVLMMGVDLATGEILWEIPNQKNWQMSHASVMPMKLGGKRMYVYSAIGGMVAVSAEKDELGKILWETTLWNHSVLAPSPLIMPNGRIFLTAGYGAGSMVLKVQEENGTYTIEKLQEFKPDLGMASEQQTPLFWKGHLFSIQPKDASGLREQFVCFNPDDCTELIWSSGETRRFGLGPYFVADGKIYILNDDGVLTMIRASTSRFELLGQAQVLNGHDAWGPIALAGTRMLLRDSKRMVCIDVGN